MTTKIFIASIIVATLVSLIAFFINLSTMFPAVLVYFIVALIGGSLTSFWLIRPKAPARSPKPKKQPARKKTKASTNTVKETGHVKWFSASKGFGFITRENGEDIFVHFRSILGSGHRILQQGQAVEFSVTDGSKGLQAEDVNPIE